MQHLQASTNCGLCFNFFWPLFVALFGTLTGHYLSFLNYNFTIHVFLDMNHSSLSVQVVKKIPSLKQPSVHRVIKTSPPSLLPR